MSSGSESDDEYVPGEPEKLSEEDSADEETESQYEKEQEIKTIKRKAAQETRGKKKRKTRKGIQEVITPVEEDNEPEKQIDPEEEKKREEELWAKFLEGTDTKPKPKSEPSKQDSKPVENIKKDMTQTNIKKNIDDNKEREKRIFEFAGETIVVEDNIIKERIKTDTPASVSTLMKAPTRSGGLSSLVGQLTKNPKPLSTLEKSKLDWNTYKKVEDIEDEVQSHNKGKEGYLERQDFLERADLRQYEQERDMRLKRRSNR